MREREQVMMQSGTVDINIKGEGMPDVTGSDSASSQGLLRVTTDISDNEGSARGSGAVAEVEVVANIKGTAGDMINSTKLSNYFN